MMIWPRRISKASKTSRMSFLALYRYYRFIGLSMPEAAGLALKMSRD